jgi:hypothetical protein
VVDKESFRYSNVFFYYHLHDPSVFRNVFLKAVKWVGGGHPAWDFLYIGRREYERNADIIGSDWRVDFSAGLPTAENGRSNLNERFLSGDKKKKS